MYQMTIFDMLRDEQPPLESMTEQEAVERVGKALGLTFKYNDFLEQWECRVGRMILDVSYSHYDMIGELDGKLFIGVGYTDRKTKEGCGAPRDSLEEAIEWFRRRMENG